MIEMLPKLQIFFFILPITCGTNLLHLKKNETFKVHLKQTENKCWNNCNK